MYTIGILTTLWKRHDLEGVVMEYYRSLEIDGVKFRRLAVGSEGDVTRFNAESSGWEYLEYENFPLTDKWNAGMRELEGVDAVLVVGSDDIVSERALRTLIAEWENGADVVDLEDLFYYSIEDDAAYYSVRAHPGAGMLIGASALMKVGWNPWPSGIDSRIDGALVNRLSTDAYPCKFKHISDCKEKEVCMVDIKSGVNKWSVDDMTKMTDRVSQIPVELLDAAFPNLRDLLKQTTTDNG